jgi:hypothetical protein
MRRFALAVLVLCVPASASLSQDTALATAKAFLAQQRYTEAARLLRGIAKEGAGSVETLYILLAVEQTRILDYESYGIDGKRFLGFADSVMSVLTARLPELRGADSLDCLFYLGNVYGGKSVILAKLGNWLHAIRNAYTSISLLESVQQADTSYHAAYLGVGLFKYYLSQNLKWLPFFGDRTEEGIADIERAAQAPFPYDIAAKNSLCWILIDRKEWHRADSVCTTVLSAYPGNTVFLRIAACIALWTQRWEEALDLGGSLVEISALRKPTNWSDLLTGYWVLVSSYDNLGVRDRCVEQADRALGLEIPEPYSKISYVKEHMAKIDKVRSRHRRKE